jgi:hypothetical protein
VIGSYVIPVELTSFEASAAEDNVKLTWRTATELNNLGFEIQRKVNDGEYNKVGFVPGFGTTTESKVYSYTDSKLNSGNYTYRLMQQDYDGSFEYSNEIEVIINVPMVYSLEQNYPNPFNPSTVISYQLPVSGLVNLKVYDVLGNEVIILVNEEKPIGSYEIEFNASHLGSGVYFYRLQSGSFVQTRKMTLLK